MRLITRLKLRQNWWLVVAGLGLVTSLFIFRDMPYTFSRTIPFDPREIVNYPNLLFKYGGFPILCILVLILFALLSLFGARSYIKSHKTLTAIIILLASASVCVGWARIELLFAGDKTKLSHIQTLHDGNMTYQLTRVRNMTDSGLVTDSFWVFRCESDEIHCLYVEHNGKEVSPALGGEYPEPSAKLTVDPASNALYLQIDDEKTLITK
jgi:hypothetical protein